MWKAPEALASRGWSSVAFLLSLEGIQHRNLDTDAELFAALF